MEFWPCAGLSHLLDERFVWGGLSCTLTLRKAISPAQVFTDSLESGTAGNAGYAIAGLPVSC